MKLTRRSWIGAALAAPAFAQQQRLKVELGPEVVIARGVPWPYLAHLRDGTTIVFGHRGWPAGGKYPVHYTGISRDGRKTWTEWKPGPAQGDGPITEGTHVELRDGRLLVFDVHAEHVGNKRFEHNHWVSRDSYRTLEGPFKFGFDLPRADSGGVDDRGEPVNRIYVRRSMIELPNGDLVASAYCRFQEDKMPVEYIGAMSKMRSILLRSKDQGKSWSYVSTISADPVEQEGAAEPVLVQVTKGPHKGRLICLLRTGRENPMYQCESDDEGATWTKIYPIRWQYSKYGRLRDLVGVDPDVTEMSDGTLAMSFGHKPDFEDHGNFVCFSTDHGKTWGEVVRISSSVTQAYTGVREVAPGELFVVYTISDRVQSPGYRDAVFTTVGRSIFVKRPASGGQSKMQWSDKAPMLRPQAGGGAALLGGELVTAGGTTWENNVKLYLSDVQIYSPVHDNWRKGPPIPEGLAYGAFAANEDALEIFGGTTGTASSRKIWRLDAAKSKWSQEGEAPADFIMGRAAHALGSTFVFGGGPDAAELHRCSSAVWKRDARGQWSQVSKIPGGAICLAAIAVAGARIYLFGGCHMPEAGKLFNNADAYEYNPANNEWRTLRSLPAAVRGPSAVAASTGTILIFGGYGEAFSAVVWAYDIASDTYTEQEPMPAGMVGIEFVRHGATIIGAGGEDKMKSRSARTLAAQLPG